MNRFTADFSSSPASEQLPTFSPHPQNRNNFSVPDDIASTTPAAPPPSQLFGSSQLGTGVSKLQFPKGTSAFPSSAPRFRPSNYPDSVTSTRPKSRLFEASTNSFTTEGNDDEYSDIATEDDMEADEQSRPRFQTINRSTGPSLLKFSSNSMRQSMQRLNQRRPHGISRSELPRRGREDIIPSLVRDICSRQTLALLSESDDTVIDTEEVMRLCNEEFERNSTQYPSRHDLSTGVQRLLLLWRRASRTRASFVGENAIGPDTNAPAFEKAYYLANLLLELRHSTQQDVTDSGALTLSRETDIEKHKVTPYVLLNWLDKNHTNYAPLFEQVITTTPAPSSNDLYWDALESFALRGKFVEVMELLKRGDLNHAVIDTPQGPQQANFTGIQLQLAEDAVFRARSLINICPAVQHDDWDMGSPDWNVYRKSLEAEIDHLFEQVETSNDSDAIQASKKKSGLFGSPVKQSGLPFIVYQRLKTVYSILLGDANEIIGLAQDWVEASIALTVWWVPDLERDVAQWSFDVSRAGISQTEDIDPYLSRLRDAFLCVTDPGSENSFQINTMSEVEIGLGAILQGDTQSYMRILETLSLCIASAVAEIGTWAGWYASIPSSNGLDQNDLMVLNYGSNESQLSKDDVLEAYASALFDKQVLRSLEVGEVEGWELSFSVLSRLDDQERVHRTVSEALQKLPVATQERAAKLVEICEQFGLVEEGRKVSETFADNLVNETSDYGTALLCYARAHAENKIRQLVDLLNSYCLVQSKAYPSDDELDPAMAQLVSNPRVALQSIADIDPQAAETLQFYLAGHACLRRFYTLRDEQTNVNRANLQPLAKKRAAAKALIAAVNSAADTIYGGLYDPDRRSAVQVDGLLTMLGEATMFLGGESRTCTLSTDQMYSLLAATEDLQTVNDRVYRTAEECMEAALRNYHGSLPPSPHAMLKKSVSSGTNSNFSFSMMGSEMLTRSEESLEESSPNLKTATGRNSHTAQGRGWDWRAQFLDPQTKGGDVLLKLRSAIARDLSTATLEEANFQW